MTNSSLLNNPPTRESVNWVFRLLLARDPAPEEVNANCGHYASNHDFTVAVLQSPEFALGKMRHTLERQHWVPGYGMKYAGFLNLCARFCGSSHSGSDGFYTDFLGAKTRVNYVPGLTHLSGIVLQPPPAPQALEFELSEWEGTLRSVLEAKGKVVAIELGAGWGPWIVTSALAARAVGIDNFELAAVEASEGHYQFMIQHLKDNGIDPDTHFINQAAVGTVDGVAQFPRLPDARFDWGAQATYDERKSGIDIRGVHFDTYDEVRCISLSTLLRRYDRVDIIHCDIQGSEKEVVPSAIEELNKRCRRIVVGTHSRAAEAVLLETFLPYGWELEAETPCHFSAEKGRANTVEDGVQVWANPGISAAGKGT